MEPGLPQKAPHSNLICDCPDQKDVLEIITVFSARLYGSRSRKNQKLLDGLQKAVDDVLP
jgi:hypothetical protein